MNDLDDLDSLKDTILAITDEINRIVPIRPLREAGDIDVFQLMRAWNMSESAVRRRMKLVGKQPETTGFQSLYVYDVGRKHEVLVLRKVDDS